MKIKQFLRISNDHLEMRRIGEDIWNANPEVYNDRRRALLNQMLNEEMPSASDKEKEEMLYISIYDYWMYGANLKEVFSLHFMEKTHEEKMEYLTFRNRFLYMAQLNDDSYAKEVLVDKYNAYLHFKEDYLRDVICIEKEEDFDAFKDFVKKHHTFVVKPVDLGFGWGIHKQTVSENDDAYQAFKSILNEGDEIQKKHHIKSHTTKFVLEELINQGEELACFHPASINCVRLTTIVVDGKVRFFYPRIKIGRHGNFISNASDGGFLIGIDPLTGQCNTNAADEYGKVYEVHPDTGIRFMGYQIPEWDKLLALGERVALDLAPRIKYVGWDMAYTPKGWSILEGNSEGEFGAQFVYKKGLKKELEELIGWKPSVEYWWEDPISTKING